jgi:hypothetical protein
MTRQGGPASHLTNDNSKKRHTKHQKGQNPLTSERGQAGPETGHRACQRMASWQKDAPGRTAGTVTAAEVSFGG